MQPVAPWVGGKRNLAARIVEVIGRTPHTLYAEPFVGMGGVFFRRPTRARVEVINDLNQDVASFFRILREHLVPFRELVRYQLTTRADFERLCITDPATLTDLQRAARFLYLQRTGFGGKVVGRSFGVSPDRPARFDVTTLMPMLEDLHGRLASVTIECLPYAEFIARYDRPATLFYCDPPYFGSEGYYGKALFGRADFERLVEALATLQGRFILSINDRTETRQLFRRFKVTKVKTTYSVSKLKAKAVGELIVTGP